MKRSYDSSSRSFVKGAATQITYRVNPCNCGCKGGDPWHAATFYRVIRSIRRLDTP